MTRFVVRGFIGQTSASRLPVLRRLLFMAVTFFILLLAMPLLSNAAGDEEEVSVFVSLQKAGVYMPGLLQEETVYLPVRELFDFLKINNRLTPTMDSAVGFIVDARAVFLIDFVQQKIQYRENSFALANRELIRTQTNLYLRSDVFGKIFGINCNFQFRNLAVIINTTIDLPLLREQRKQVLHLNSRKIKGEVKPDTTVKQAHPFFRLGTADWNIVHSKEQAMVSATRMTLQLGGMLAGGEAQVSLTYDSKSPFATKQQQYKWRYVNNNLHVLKQVSLGNLAVQATASLYAPVIGIQVTNAPTNRRRSFGTYVISDHTQPGWQVELYVNNVLVNEVKADASGFYSFPVPLVYGSSRITLKFFGPSGEEQSSEKIIQVPFSFLPVHTFEYTFSSGLVRDSLHSRFSKLGFHYGVSNRITVGGGLEYLSSVKSGTRMPFFYTTIRLAKTALLSSEYTGGVRWKNQVTWQLYGKAQVEVNYLRYAKGQQAIITNNLEERMAAVSLPMQKRKFFLLSKLAVRQVIIPVVDYDASGKGKYSDNTKTASTSAELTLSSSISKLNVNLTTAGYFYGNSKANLSSTLAFAWHFPHGLLFRPQFQYNFSQGKLITAKFETEKPLSNQGLINFSFARDFLVNVNTVSIGVRYNFSFLRTAFTLMRRNKTTTLVQSAGGGLLYDAPSGYATHNRQSHSGRGSLVVAPFLDMNGNSKRDPDEPGVRGLRVGVNGGRVLPTAEEALLRITDLEPYTSYLLELDEKSLGNIAWQIKHKKISVVVEPNVFKRVDVPVAVVGEVSGMVYFGSKEKKVSGVLVKFYDSTGQLAAQSMTESDGWFSYLGLKPGKYTAQIDAVQLQKMNFISTPVTQTFQIDGSKEGAVSDGLRFVLRSPDKKSVDRDKSEQQ